MNNAIQTGADLAANQAFSSSSLMSRFARRNGTQTVDKAAKDFEGMFMAQMLQPMFQTVQVNSLFGGGHGEEVMRGFLVQEYGKMLAKGSHFGIAEAVSAEMTRKQLKSEGDLSTQNDTGATNAVESIQ